MNDIEPDSRYYIYRYVYLYFVKTCWKLLNFNIYYTIYIVAFALVLFVLLIFLSNIYI